MRTTIRRRGVRATLASVATGAAIVLGTVAVQPASATIDDEGCADSYETTQDSLLVSFSPYRIDATDLGDRVVGLTGALLSSDKPFIFLALPENTGATEVKFWLDDVDDGILDCSLNPRIDRSAGTIADGPTSVAYDFFGGNVKRATGFSLSQLEPGRYKITTQRTTATIDPDNPTVVHTVELFDVA